MSSSAGILVIGVEGARDLQFRRQDRKHDVYCVVRVGAQVATTQVAMDAGSSPVWNQTFQCQVADGDYLEVEVKDARARRGHHHARHATLPLASIRAAGSQRLEVPLFVQRGLNSRDQKGVVCLTLTYWPPGSVHHHQHPTALPLDTATAAATGLLSTGPSTANATAAATAPSAPSAADAKLSAGATAPFTPPPPPPPPAAAPFTPTAPLPPPPPPPLSPPQGVCIGVPVVLTPGGYYPAIPSGGPVQPPVLHPPPPPRPGQQQQQQQQAVYGASLTHGPNHGLGNGGGGGGGGDGGLFHGPVDFARSALEGATEALRTTRETVARTAAQASEAVSSALGGGRPAQRPLLL